MRTVSKLEPAEYCGLCKILMVPLKDEDGNPLPFDVSLERLMDNFLGMKKKPRRQLMALLAVLARGDKHGASPED